MPRVNDILKTPASWCVRTDSGPEEVWWSMVAYLEPEGESLCGVWTLKKRSIYVYPVLNSMMHIPVEARDSHWEPPSTDIHFILWDRVSSMNPDP